MRPLPADPDEPNNPPQSAPSPIPAAQPEQLANAISALEQATLAAKNRGQQRLETLHQHAQTHHRFQSKTKELASRTQNHRQQSMKIHTRTRTSTSKQLAEVFDTCHSLEQQNHALKEELRQLTRQLSSYQRILEQTRQDDTSTGDKLDQFTQQGRTLRTQLSKAQHGLSRKQTDKAESLEHAQRSLQQTTTQNQRLQTVICQLQNQLRQQQKASAGLSRELQTSRGKLLASEDNLNSARQQLTQARSALEDKGLIQTRQASNNAQPPAAPSKPEDTRPLAKAPESGNIPTLTPQDITRLKAQKRQLQAEAAALKHSKAQLLAQISQFCQKRETVQESTSSHLLKERMRLLENLHRHQQKRYRAIQQANDYQRTCPQDSEFTTLHRRLARQHVRLTLLPALPAKVDDELTGLRQDINQQQKLLSQLHSLQQLLHKTGHKLLIQTSEDERKKARQSLQKKAFTLNKTVTTMQRSQSQDDQQIILLPQSGCHSEDIQSLVHSIVSASMMALQDSQSLQSHLLNA